MPRPRSSAPAALALALLLGIPTGLGTLSAPTVQAQGARIVNGLPTFDFPSAGALLLGNDPDTATTHCAGTMIGCETFLTAAHCICDFDGIDCQSSQLPEPDDYLVFLQHAGFFTISSIALRSDYDFPEADVAVIRLDSAVDGVAPTPINTIQSPGFGTPGTVVGFGRSGGFAEDFGVKRTGDVVTASCSGGISNTTSLCWDFLAPVGPPGDDSNTCNADSGGPLFVDFGSGPVVAGVTSGGTAFDCLAPDSSYDANVHHYRSWIQAEGGADLSLTSCGSLAQVGQPGATVEGFVATLSSGKPEGRHSFSVPPGATELRVTMNASEEAPNDFDLYVRAGAPPSTSNFDCAVADTGQWAYCEFASPAATTWHVLVDRFAGDGEYQVTATIFEPVPDCSDGLDNDGDGLLDHPSDPGCDSAGDGSERSALLACDDGLDNDSDGRLDFDPATFAAPGDSTTPPAGSGDPGCKNPGWLLEDPECQNGVDDADPDGGKLDYDAGRSVLGSPDPAGPDPNCLGTPWRNREGGGCGLGFELTLVLWSFARLRTAARA